MPLVVSEILFWLSVMLILYTNVGYPLLLMVSRRVVARRDVGEAFEENWPPLSIIMVAYNEESRIAEKINNLLACDYPGVVEIVLACDGCTDQTAAVARAIDPQRVLVVEGERAGKPAGLNRAVARASGEVLVFADVRQSFDRQALRHLVAPFCTADVVGVSGSLDICASDGGTAQGVDLYWRLEKFIRESESIIDSCIGCTGAIYALRKDHFQPLPADTILDDVVVPMQAALRGGRVLFSPAAKAYDPQQLTAGNEKRRKTRTLAGNFQMLFRHLTWLSPFHNRLWWQLLSHKYLRLLVPALMVCALVTSGLLWSQHWIYQLALVSQLTLYSLAAVGSCCGIQSRLLSGVSGFVYLQVLCVGGFIRYFRSFFGCQGAGW